MSDRAGPVLWCAGIPIQARTRSDAAVQVMELAREPKALGADVHLCNAYTLALADTDPQLRKVLLGSRLNFPDGKSVVWANRLRDRNAPRGRVYGPDLFVDVIDAGRQHGLSHFLLGSTRDVLDEMEVRLRERFPGVVLAGSYSPPFGGTPEEERAKQIALIRRSEAQLIWVGLGTPKQDFEAAWLAALTPGVFIAVGAAFDFVAGVKLQAPTWVGDHGLEWLFRLATEPRRLWRRYLFGNLRFLKAVATRWRSSVDPDDEG